MRFMFLILRLFLSKQRNSAVSYNVGAQGPELTGTAGAPWSPASYEANSLEGEIGYGGGESAYRVGGPSSVGTRPALYRTYAEGSRV